MPYSNSYPTTPLVLEVSMQTLKLSELAARVGGRLVINNTYSTGAGACHDQTQISDALPLQDAVPGCITLVDHPKHLPRLQSSPAAAVMVTSELANCTLPQVVVTDLHACFQQAIALLRPQVSRVKPVGIHPGSHLAPSARIGSQSTIAAGVIIGEDCVVGERCVLHAGVQLMDGCVIGDDSELYPNVILYPDTRIGARVLIHATAVLGAYGFGYRPQQGRHVRTAQLGWVEVGDDVEIGAGTTIDRGTYGPTRIGDGTKIDNQVQIGHNCHIGKHNLICAQVGIAGSTSTGQYVVLAGQVGLADHLQLANNVTVGAKSGVMNNLEQGVVVFGSPAVPRRQRLLELANLARLPELRKELKELQEQVAQLQQQLAADSHCEPRHRHSA